MKSRIILLGLGAFALALLAVLPVSWVAKLLPAQVQCAGWRGSIWSAQCSGLIVAANGMAPVKLATVRWKIHPHALLRLALNADVQVSDPEGNATGVLELGLGQRIVLQDVAVQAPFDRRFAAMLPAGWTGRIEAQHLALRLKGMRIDGVSGDLQLRNLDDGRGAPLGSYRLVFAPGPPPFVGKLADTGGPLAVSASLTVTADRSWMLDGTVAARASAGPALRQTLDILGAPDAAGKRRLSAAGSFN
ncbi:MAG: type II secretion system protein N [Steroidobacteraceae bacterium]